MRSVCRCEARNLLLRLPHLPYLANWYSVQFSAGLVISKNKQMQAGRAGEQSTWPWLCLYEVCYPLSKKISVSLNYFKGQDSQIVVQIHCFGSQICQLNSFSVPCFSLYNDGLDYSRCRNFESRAFFAIFKRKICLCLCMYTHTHTTQTHTLL